MDEERAARSDGSGISRRATLAAVTAGGLSAAGGVAAQEGTATETGDGSGGTTKTVKVGPDGEFVFSPGTDEPLTISPGTTVRFVWESDNHNIVVDSQPDDADWSGMEDLENTGFEYEHTFETPGTYEYFCEPHKAAGMEATIEVRAESSGGGGSGGGTAEVVVGPGGELVFDPETVEVTPGTTVRWAWDSDNHNVVVDSQPEDASWEGQPEDETFDTGHEYTHTFETLGTYEYYCQPHLSAGMKGTVEVVEEVAGSGGGEPAVPPAAKTLAAATAGGVALVLALAVGFLKYGGSGPVEE